MATTNNYYKIKHGLEAPSQDTIQVTESTRPTIRPTLNLNFAQAKVLDPRITFTRASTATYYGTRTAKAEENFLKYSQEIDNAYWFKGFVTIDANSTIAPDGTLTADRVTEQATSSVHYINTVTNDIVTYMSGTAYTYSLYVKKGTGATAPNIIQLSLASGPFASPQYANFDISVSGATSGTITASSNGTASITAIGSGWYRCSWTATATSTLLANSNCIFLCNNNPTSGRLPNYAGAITSDVFIWGAQLEARSTATAYTPTVAQPITTYIPVLETAASGVARFDHNPTTFESLGLEIEEQRTNLVTYSEQFDNAAWVKSNITITANTIVAPDGTLTGDKLVENTINAFHYQSQNITVTNATTYTFSVYAKYSNRFLVLYSNARGGIGVDDNVIFNLTTGTVSQILGTVTASITSVGNGWYRCSINVTAGATASRTFGITLTTSSSSVVSYAGDNFSGAFIWGAQLEVGAKETSYIPTVASQVTRAADGASMTGTNFSSWFNQSEGTFYQDLVPIGISADDRYSFLASESGSPTVNAHHLRNYNGNQVAASYALGSAQSDIFLGAISAQVPIKVAYTYKTNDFAASRNGAAAIIDTLGVSPTNVAQLSFPSSGCNYIKKFAYYPLRLTNAQLQALTS